ncbi:hypothetical protein [Pedosphaera parvula]|uniref:Uncharacterized protein n=1 Tax=Pedosphaera parvula (strain Ellin514) TaxID=320771 RepID=B9XNL5_PEDPL|nr:hypothetical protein [Pedosphaera parvula]EEF58555.1 hypothetical protein Cflav_PD1745 [Pedosphaera parvula Ellin514]
MLREKGDERLLPSSEDEKITGDDLPNVEEQISCSQALTSFQPDETSLPCVRFSQPSSLAEGAD